MCTPETNGICVWKAQHLLHLWLNRLQHRIQQSRTVTRCAFRRRTFLASLSQFHQSTNGVFGSFQRWPNSKKQNNETKRADQTTCDANRQPVFCLTFCSRSQAILVLCMYVLKRTFTAASCLASGNDLLTTSCSRSTADSRARAKHCSVDTESPVPYTKVALWKKCSNSVLRDESPWERAHSLKKKRSELHNH